MMKLILFLIVVMFKCSRLSSSAPTDTESSISNKNNSDDYTSSSSLLSSSPNVAYVSEDDDLGKTGVVFQFRRSIKSDNTEIEARRRSAIDKGFMRFGRSRNMVRFGRSNSDKIQYDNDANDVEHDENELANEPYSMRMRKGNMMRFGRGNMMRFGRNYPVSKSADKTTDDADYNNDASEVYDFVEQPVRRDPENAYDEHGKKILRLGRSSSSSESLSDENFDVPQYSLEKSKEREKKPTEGNVLRFGRSDNKNMMRFGRSDSKNMMRFGRGNMMRFGRGNMMRFGRGNMMRFGRSDKSLLADNDEFVRSSRAGNVMRFGRSDKNPMRFGKRSPMGIASSSKIYCEENNCLIQEKENRLLENIDENDADMKNINNEDLKKDQLNSLFGDDTKQQGFGEYILAKK